MDLATVDKLLTTTRTVRKRLDFTHAVDPAIIQTCLEIAIQAPTGGNIPRYHFVVVTDEAKRVALAALYKRAYCNEYRMMARFCLSVDDEDMRDDLCNAIRGRGAFRRFKDRIQAYGMAEAWYRYRDAALREIAMAWCEEHGIPYTE
jgi:nitroreductase